MVMNAMVESLNKYLEKKGALPNPIFGFYFDV